MSPDLQSRMFHVKMGYKSYTAFLSLSLPVHVPGGCLIHISTNGWKTLPMKKMTTHTGDSERC